MRIKRIVALTLAAISATLILSGCSKSKEPISAAALTSLSAKNSLHLTAHRGVSSQAPENSLAAFRLAGSMGYYACEFDIHATSDGVWVVMHDDDIKRTTNGKGNISEKTYAELDEYTIDSGSNVKQYPNEKIPNLSEVLDICEQYGMRPMIEIKSGTNADIDSLLTTLDSRNMIDDSIIISFGQEYLEYIRKANKDAEIWLLTMEITDDVLTFAKSIDATIAFNHKEKKNLTAVSQNTDSDIRFAAWTVDDMENAQLLYDMGVRYITTNRLVP